MGHHLMFQLPTLLKASNIHSRSQSAPEIGGWVRILTVDLYSMHRDDTAVLASIMECLSKLHDLTIVYEKGCMEERPEFLRAVCRYQSLKRLRVKEKNLDLKEVPDGYVPVSPRWHFPDHLINGVLSSEYTRLETLAHVASLPLQPAVFAKVQAQAHFRTLVFRSSVQFNLRDLFNSPTRWGCANTLTKLVIRTCSGTNYAVIAAHVAAGVFGNLAWLSVINSGDEDPQMIQALISKPPAWQVRVLDRLDVDHASDLEVTALSTIHVMKVNITRVFRRTIIEVLDKGGWPELKVLCVHRLGDETVPSFTELKRACETRNILLETGAEPYGSCHCHNE